MPPLPPALAAIMVAFQALFSKPVFERALVLVAGALLAVHVGPSRLRRAGAIYLHGAYRGQLPALLA